VGGLNLVGFKFPSGLATGSRTRDFGNFCARQRCVLVPSASLLSQADAGLVARVLF